MARTKAIQTRADGSMFYELARTKRIDVPGTKGLKMKERVEVPQLPTEGDPDVLMQTAINSMEGDTDKAKMERLVGIINAGLVADAQVKIQTVLNKRMGGSQIVSDFSNIVTLTASMFDATLTAGDRAKLILEKFPNIAQQLEAAGLELAGEDDDDEEEVDE